LVGIPAAFAVGRSVESLLYGVKPFDVTVVACAAAVLLALAAIAALGPATRARRMDPMSALRCE
jgi:ABC-type antimicrobial peptide transport system permease subunit